MVISPYLPLARTALIAGCRDAIEAFDAALRVKPDYPQAHFNRGVALQAACREEEAIASSGRHKATLEVAKGEGVQPVAR